MNQFKIAHLTTIDVSIRYLLLNQLCSFRDEGYEVVSVSTSGPEVEVIEKENIRHIAVPMTRRLTPWADLVSLWRLYHIMRREKFTIVHTHTPKPGLLGQIAARMARVPIVINTLHGFYFHDAMHPLKRRFYILTEKIAALCSDVILSQNSEDVKTAIREGICKADKIKCLGNGIDVKRFDQNRLDSSILLQKRQEIGLPDTSPVIGFVGRLVEEKGILELLEAAQTVLKKFPEAKFLLVGAVDSEKEDALTPSIAENYGVSRSFVFAGMRQDMPELYALMDVFVLPSHREGFPRSPMEASAMGVPCIVTDIRGCREAVEHDRNGVLVPLKNAQALADAILDLLQDDNKRQRLGECGRQMAQERFDERLVFEKVKSEYMRLLNEKICA